MIIWPSGNGCVELSRSPTVVISSVQNFPSCRSCCTSKQCTWSKRTHPHVSGFTKINVGVETAVLFQHRPISKSNCSGIDVPSCILAYCQKSRFKNDLCWLWILRWGLVGLKIECRAMWVRHHSDDVCELPDVSMLFYSIQNTAVLDVIFRSDQRERGWSKPHSMKAWSALCPQCSIQWSKDTKTSSLHIERLIMLPL